MTLTSASAASGAAAAAAAVVAVEERVLVRVLAFAVYARARAQGLLAHEARPLHAAEVRELFIASEVLQPLRRHNEATIR